MAPPSIHSKPPSIPSASIEYATIQPMHTRWLVLPALLTISLLSACAGAPPITLTNPLTPCPATDYQMVWWSPDGGKLAFISKVYDPNSDVSYELFVMETTGTGLKRIASDVAFEDNSMFWSPDGQKIAYVANTLDDSNEVFVVGADGTGLVQISDNKYWEGDSPSWSPDSMR